MNKTQCCIKAETKDASSVALLHKKGIPTGFLSQQSLSFLTALYSYLVKNEIVYVIKESGVVVGFISGTLTTNGLYSRFLKKNLSLLILLGVKNIFSVSFIKKAFETLIVPKKTLLDDSVTEFPELLSIVVEKSFKGQGLGHQLLQIFEANLATKEVTVYKVLVGEKLRANLFYKKNGFTLSKKNIELHKGSFSHIYVKKL